MERYSGVVGKYIGYPNYDTPTDKNLYNEFTYYTSDPLLKNAHGDLFKKVWYYNKRLNKYMYRNIFARSEVYTSVLRDPETKKHISSVTISPFWS